MAHFDRAPARFADSGESLGKNLIQGFFFGGFFGVGVFNALKFGGNARAEFNGFGAELLVGKLLRAFFQCVDLGHDRPQALEHAIVRSAKNLG